MKDFLKSCFGYWKGCCKRPHSLLKITWDYSILTLSLVMLKNGQTCLKDLAVSERKIFKVCLAVFQNCKEGLIYYPQLSESWYFEIRFIKQLILYLITNVWRVACNFTFILRNLLTRTKSLHEKCPNTQFFLVCIFLNSDWIQRLTP